MANPKNGRRPSGWPEPSLVDRARGRQGHAFAEYLRRGERLRLVWEGTDEVLWLEAARERDPQIISRWTDIEWILAGARRPLNPDTADGRIAEIVMALAEYLERGSRAPTVSSLTDSERDSDD